MVASTGTSRADDSRAADLDTDTVVALREILNHPALPVGTTLADGGGPRVAVLREALDHLTTLRVTAIAARSTADGDRLLVALAGIDAGLADTLRWHVALAPVIAEASPGRARNGLLGDIGRGEVITWSDAVRSWTWEQGHVPVPDLPLGRVTGEVEVDDHPSLYDAVLVWEPTARALVVVPTHRDRVTWTPVGPADANGRTRWVLALDRVTFHADDLVPLDAREQPGWREPPAGAFAGIR
ncbi:hypothetical protein ACFYVR_25285 [Rhodococcus sp. NPDC003318]|uniref:hypothetical protein n=1 Tax=Rhodococcus sp. NPDC003318 TaxID=3364503 RepID=UPI003677F2D8